MAQCHGAWDSESSRWAGDGKGSKGEEQDVRAWTRAHLSGRTHAQISAESTRGGLRRERGSHPACLLSVSLYESHSAESRDLGAGWLRVRLLHRAPSRNARTHAPGLAPLHARQERGDGCGCGV